jgi:hypothetical protein
MSKHCAPLASLTRGDPLAELLAKKIIAQIGIRDAGRHLCSGDQGNRHPHLDFLHITTLDRVP